MPILRIAGAIAALASLGAYAPASTQEGVPAELHPEIVQVKCIEGAGSAFYVGPNVLLSVAHVTSLHGCFVGNSPVSVIRTQGDFSILRAAEPVDKWLRVDCGGFKGTKTYTAWGFARGLSTLTSVDITATGQMQFGFSRLWGVFNVIPGQSGGPIEDPETGKAVGTVNVYNAQRGDSGSVALKDSPVCSHS